MNGMNSHQSMRDQAYTSWEMKSNSESKTAETEVLYGHDVHIKESTWVMT